MSALQILEKLERIERIIRANKPVLSFEEAAEYTGLSKSYLYKLTARGEIPYSKPRGKMIYFSRKTLDEWLLQNSFKSLSDLEQEAISYTAKNKKFQ